MTIKAILTTLDGLDDATKAFYAQDGDNFVLDVAKYTTAQVDKKTGGLKAKADELLAEAKAAKKAKVDADEAARKAADDAARKSGDVEALEKSWQKKLDDAVADRDAQNVLLKSAVESLTKGAAAKTLAAELAVEGSASVLEDVILKRLSVDNSDDGPLVRVLDKDGKPSAANMADLKTELTAEKALAPLIAASKANGGGAPNANGGAGNKKFSGMSGGELVRLKRENPQEYDRLKAAG